MQSKSEETSSGLGASVSSQQIDDSAGDESPWEYVKTEALGKGEREILFPFLVESRFL